MTIGSLCRLRDISNLSPIPMSAYALSLAFSITFKQYRESKVPSARLLAKENLETLHKCLEKMSDTWWLATVMLRLGKRAFEKIQPSTNTESPSSFTILTEQSQDGNSHSGSIQPWNAAQPIESGAQQYPNETHNSGNTSNMDFVLPSLSSDFSTFWDNSPVEYNNAESFDAFFNSFPDVNFPSSSIEQFLWETGT